MTQISPRFIVVVHGAQKRSIESLLGVAEGAQTHLPETRRALDLAIHSGCIGWYRALSKLWPLTLLCFGEAPDTLGAEPLN